MGRHWGPVLAGLITLAGAHTAPLAADEPVKRVLGTETVRAGPHIAWRVENPFRFFVDPADTEVHRATFASLSPQQRQSPVLAAEQDLSRRHPDGWASAMKGPTCWDPVHNLHVCPDAAPYISPDQHRVAAELANLPDGGLVDCTWLVTPPGNAPSRSSALTQPCDRIASLAVPYPQGAVISVEIGGREIARTMARVSDLLVVGMGDSFASGEGNPDVPVRFSRERSADYDSSTLAGYPARVGAWRAIGDAEFIAGNARWLDQACHRSLYSHQMRAALQLAIEVPHRAVTFVGVACSGAEIVAGLFLRYRGNEWVPNPPEHSQISAVAEAQCGAHEAPLHDLPEAYHMKGAIPELKGGLVLRKCPAEHARKIDLLLLSVGGNDIGFSRLVANAVLADRSLLKRLGGWFGQVHGVSEAAAQLESLDIRYRALNRALHNVLHVPWAESDRIILTAYPALALLEDGKSVCPDGEAGMDVLPEFRLSAKRARDGSAVAERLNAVMRASAREHGWTFADQHRDRFLGRGVCAGWADLALTSVDDLRLPRKVNGEWHPYNPADYRPYAPRQRWFRTPNDAFMTGNFHISASLLQRAMRMETLSWFQLLLAATYSGAFHPTAEGQAAIADAVVDKARAVLAKYDRQHAAATE
ncbi:MAG TPA: hypothetical protein VNK52_14035 [Hyphomicrobiaceae bacterium]|nr:hypothetical protein [Hyphomicrobiaceae bacterium]